MGIWVNLLFWVSWLTLQGRYARQSSFFLSKWYKPKPQDKNAIISLNTNKSGIWKTQKFFDINKSKEIIQAAQQPKPQGKANSPFPEKWKYGVMLNRMRNT